MVRTECRRRCRRAGSVKNRSLKAPVFTDVAGRIIACSAGVPSEIDLLSKRFIVFEIDAIKDNKELFPIVTIVLMEVFINKMRRLKGTRKMLIIEEAWKALASNNMASYVQYLCAPVQAA